MFIHKYVYKPSDDTWLLIGMIDEELVGKNRVLENCLDLGCGSGVVGLYLLKRNVCRKTFFLDINPHAVENTFVNLTFNGVLNRSVVLMNDDVDINSVDLVVSNPPYLPRDEFCCVGDYDELNLIGGVEGYETVLGFIDIAHRVLAPNGLFFTVYSSLSKPNVIENYLELKGFNVFSKTVKKFFYEEIVAVGAVKLEN